MNHRTRTPHRKIRVNREQLRQLAKNLMTIGESLADLLIADYDREMKAAQHRCRPEKPRTADNPTCTK